MKTNPWGISVIIPNLNGKELLKKNLPSLFNALRNYPGASEVMVVDDGSSDGSVPYLKDAYPQIRVVELKENRGFSSAVNEGVNLVRNEIIFLLNADVEVTERFLEPLLSHFEDQKVFAVSSRAVAEEGKSMASGRCGLEFRRGFLRMIYEEDKDRPAFTFRASGGHSAFHRKKFLELGSFDELYSPFYSEDEDICYRAWKRGWKVLYEPGSVVYHACQGTIGKAFNKGYAEMVFRRNKFLFFWKNIRDRRFWLQHIFFLPFYLTFGLVSRPYFTLAFFLALGRIGRVVAGRRREKRFSGLKDREVIRLIQDG